MHRYYDGQSNDSRLNIAINRTAVDFGATCLNYAEVIDFLHSPCPNHKQEGEEKQHERIDGVVVRDKATGEEIPVRAKLTINAAGPGINSLLTLHEQTKHSYSTTSRNDSNPIERITLSKGIHLLLPKYVCPSSTGLVTTTSDDRVLFILPWQN